MTRRLESQEQSKKRGSSSAGTGRDGQRRDMEVEAKKFRFCNNAIQAR